MSEPPPERTPPPPVPPPGAGGRGPAPAAPVPPPTGAPGAPTSDGPAPGAVAAPAGALDEPPLRPGLDGRERSLDPKVVAVWRVTGAIWSLLPLAVLTVLGFVLLGRGGWLVAAAAAVLLALRVGWVPPARYARWRWQLSSLALELRYGILVRQYEAVPYFRIQQIDITQGPIDRLLGLATLVVTTASASGSASLPGIAASDAPLVRAELLARAADAVAEHPGDLRDAV